MNSASNRYLRRSLRSFWNRSVSAGLLFGFVTLHAAAQSTGTGDLSSFINPLKSGLNLITVFGFIAGCVMVIGGFLNARKDENWKMMVIYGIGVAGSVALMKALFSLFGGTAASTISGF
jgi:hypothetical protein